MSDHYGNLPQLTLSSGFDAHIDIFGYQNNICLRQFLLERQNNAKYGVISNVAGILPAAALSSRWSESINALRR